MRRPALGTLALGVFGVALLGALDALSGTEISFSIFYLLPISLVTVRGGTGEGLATAGVSAVVWLFADLAGGAQYSSAMIPYWNALVRLGYFALHTVLLARLYGAMTRERLSARRDALTGVANWRHFREQAEIELERATRTGRPLTLAYADLDDFKSINDRLGHEGGDRVLLSVARTLSAGVRRMDIVARVGGDEFIVLLPETGTREATRVLERLCARVREETAAISPVGLSCGAVTHLTPPPDVDALLHASDELMYEVKRSRKGGVRVVQQGDGADAAAARQLGEGPM
ncbi:MAG TPA: GGDEF domain-containing protein [Longimicrobiales bacterium]|nr:GGDEF domain-containing protein [Longimicrobiales bacterium]